MTEPLSNTLKNVRFRNLDIVYEAEQEVDEGIDTGSVHSEQLFEDDSAITNKSNVEGDNYKDVQPIVSTGFEKFDTKQDNSGRSDVDSYVDVNNRGSDIRKPINGGDKLGYTNKGYSVECSSDGDVGKHIASISLFDDDDNDDDDEKSGSPFDIVCKVVHGVTASGSALTQGVSGKEASFDVDLSACPGRDLDVTVYGPSGQPVHSRVLYSGRGDLHKVNFAPKESGVHTIDILYGGLHINGSPFHPDFRQGKVTLQDVPKTAYVNKRSRFKIDASEVKKGTLEIDSDLPVVATDKLEENVYLVTIQPRQTGIHDLIIKYNDIIVEGCPLEVEVKKASDFNVR